MTLEERLIDAGYEGAVMIDGYDEAAIGISEEGRVIYDYYKMIDCLVERDGMTADEAAEWIDYNTVRSLPYLGKEAPIILYPLLEE